MHDSSFRRAFYDDFYADEYAEFDDFMLDLLNFFPIDKVDIISGTHDQYIYDLKKTVADNYKTGNYQVSFFYSHLIFMSYVYYCIEKANKIFPERMKDIYYPMNTYIGRSDKPDMNGHGSVYDFSKLPEKEIFKLFYIMGLEDSKIKQLSRYVSDRDDYAHATGKGNISEETLQNDIKTILGNMRMLNDPFQSVLKKSYIGFLLEYCDNYPYDTVLSYIGDFIADNALSIEDIYYLCNLGISGIRNENESFKNNYRHIRKVHCAFIEYCIEVYEIEKPEHYGELRDEAYLHFQYEDQAKKFVERELKINAYRCEKNGGEFPVYDCPECDYKQLVYNAETNKYHCFHCSKDFEGEDLAHCSECNIITYKSETGMCSNCEEEKMPD